VHALAIDPQDPRILYAGTLGGGVFSSADAGATWTQSSRGLGEHKGVQVDAVAIDPQSSRTVFAGTCDGVFQSTDGAASWNGVNTGLTSTDIRALAIDPQRPETLFAGGWGWYQQSTTTRQAEPGGVSKTLDGGKTWVAVGGVLAGKDVAALAIDPHETEIVYAGTTDGLFWSSDGGASWQAGGLVDYVCALAIDPMRSEEIYAGTYSRGVFRSTDWGESWSHVSVGLGTLWVNSLAIDPRAPEIAYASTAYGRVFRTVDSGSSWLAIGPT
jgi:photosystem II stability/assembly factor-like uncharacterized protein